jgi:hypothetical protein
MCDSLISSSEYSHKSEAIVPDSFNFSLQNKTSSQFSKNNKSAPSIISFFKGEDLITLDMVL